MELVSDETITDIDDETLKRIVNAGDMWWGDPGVQSMAAELLQLRAEKGCGKKLIRKIHSSRIYSIPLYAGKPYESWDDDEWPGLKLSEKNSQRLNCQT